MNILPLKPRQALNKAFRRLKPSRIEIDNFKANLVLLLDRINNEESEEFHKNMVADFLKDTYYKQRHFINTKGRNDLVIHNGDSAKNSVGVIIEAKKPTNKTEMMTPQNLNVKALQELVLYYLRERITLKNIEIRHLIVTNINEWFIFDATLFDRLFAQNKLLVQQFDDFEQKRLADTKTDFFYKQIAEPFINSLTDDISFTYFNLQDYQAPLRNADGADDNLLIALFKILSPEHLLKLPFANDSNSLDKDFYAELLHILGLTETQHNGKKLIERKKTAERNPGSILENTIVQLDNSEKLYILDNPQQFGENQQEQLFNIALELSITWINRILFLKLLEGQLINYHKGDKNYAFFSLDKIRNYHALNYLFFKVLAKQPHDRDKNTQRLFGKIPYLNSSLFEMTELELRTLIISTLEDEQTLPIASRSVLKDTQGKRRTGDLPTLEYLLAFLNAYDFSSTGSEEIQEDNKTLINASVLGLIFEKINGYKDGSFFTPGFITMYMCREIIRKAVLQKFNDVKKWNCLSFGELYEHITDRKEANEIVNSVKICDPAVGSGHFLVSALNEMIAIKSELSILQDRAGRRLKEYQVEVVNDEIIVTDEDGDLFEYKPKLKESQRVQEALFHEKQTIIENCLFGVDINPNSVKICRLRLWIELLKNAYYKNANELETLPNIDINIKTGNSLVSRFAIDADLKQTLKKSKWTIEGYRIAVATYRNAEDKTQKQEMERLIDTIKKEFRSEMSLNDPRIKKLSRISGELVLLTKQTQLFERSKKEETEWKKKVEQLAQEVQKLEQEIEAIKSNKIFQNAFEWRFEFPEVLNDDGDFVGFDVVLGNPPYIQLQSIKEISEQLQHFEYKTFERTGDIYSLFYEKGNMLLKQNGLLAFITSNKWMRAGYGKTTRNYFLQFTQPELLIDLGGGVFDEATVDSNILIFRKQDFQNAFLALDISKEKELDDMEAFAQKKLSIKPQIDENWIIANETQLNIKTKIERIGKPLKDWDVQIYRGILTGYNEAFIIDGAKKDELIAADPNSADIIKPILRGRDIKRYKADFVDLWLIHAHNGIKNHDHLTKKEQPYIIEPIRVWEDYPAIYKHLLQFKDALQERQDQGDHWTNLRNCAYFQEFEKEKIVWKRIGSIIRFQYENTGCLCLDSTCFLTGKNVKFLIAFLNSSVAIKQLLENSPKTGTGDVITSVQALEPILVPDISLTAQQPFIDLVEKILHGKEIGTDTTALEKEIDQLVYQLYDLTAEEIAVIEAQ